MRYILTLLLSFAISASSGQGFTYPSIKNSAPDLLQFIPGGWLLLDSTSGDLNKDQHADIAFVIEHRDSVLVINTENNYPDTVLTQPRILIIAFYNPGTKQYELKEQSNTFILSHDNPNMDEPFQDISISAGILKIDFSIFMNAGGWEMSDNSYKFRYQSAEFYLVGADHNSTNRASGKTDDRSYDFLTKKKRVAEGNISDDKQKVTWRTFKLKELKTLKTFTQPFTWELEKGDYL